MFSLALIWKKNSKWLVKLLAIFLFIIFFIIILLFFLNYYFVEKFYPNVSLGQVHLGGLTMNQAQKIFRAKNEEFNREGQKFFSGDRSINIYPSVISLTDPDLSQELINLNFEAGLNQAFVYGRRGSWGQQQWQRIKALVVGEKFDWPFVLKTVEIKKTLTESFQSLESKGNNPGLIWDDQGRALIKSEKVGLHFDYDGALIQLMKNLANLSFQPIELKLKLHEPQFHEAEAWPLVKAAEEIIKLAPLIIKNTTTDEFNQEKIWSVSVSRSELEKWLDFNWQEQEQKVFLGFNQVVFDEFLSVWGEKINQPVKEAKFVLTDGRVTEFQSAEPGLAIDQEATLSLWSDQFFNNHKKKLSFVLKQIMPESKTADINNLNIKELIGVGESNFTGSPVNRRHNIKIGAESINGILIKPGEEFSLNKSLGDITAARGYLPELVIKGNKTEPEYGGGLCQIATTMFRLAINTGLSIFERKPHAYRVSYYEPAGTDATIYAPSPDLKFKNDTPYNLLLQTKVDLNKNLVRFEFWSTSDGRQVATTTPKIFNIVRPPETKYVETTDLPPEKIKCTEVAHSGADTEFNRTIIYADGQVKEETWKSHYRPWQAVCLVGIDPSKATSTTPIITP
ncbi:MAG TPA: VanW family protein [bacterium]|nr:VanW family protein [bacterium]HPL95739.1 VanW family protein [bacterium]